MKYNRSEIMKAAWDLVKTVGMTISAALKSAWASAKSAVKIIANGTEKQNAWAADIINKPIAQVKESIARHESYVARGYACEGKVIEPLRAAVAMYETRLKEFADTLTARFVIDNREHFSRMMYNFVSKTLKAAGMNGNHGFCKA